MPVLDELIVETRVNLAGLTAGFREAEAAAARTQAKLKELLTIPTGSTGQSSFPIRAMNAELRETEALHARIGRQIVGTFPTGATSNILQHQRSVNAELREAERIQARISRQFEGRADSIRQGFVGTPLPFASSSIAQHKKELEEAEKASDRFARSLATQGERLKSVGVGLTMGVTAPLAFVATASAKAALEFDALITKMSTLGGVSPQMAQSWRAPILALSVATGRKPEDMAEAAYRIASSGLSDKSQVLPTLEVAAKGSALGMGSVTDISEAITSAMNAYTSFGLDASKATGQLIEAMTRGKGEAKDFAPILGTLGVTAGSVGISFAQMAAGVAAITKLGAPASEASTMVARLVDEFSAPRPHSMATAKALGISFEEIQKTLKQPQGLLDVLELVRNRTGGSAALERELFPRLEGFRANLALSGPHMAEARETFAAVTLAGPQTVTERFGIAAQSDAFKMQQAGAAIDVAKIQLGTELLKTLGPQIAEFANDVASLTKAFSNLPDSAKTATVKFLELAAVLGPAGFLVGSIEKFISTLMLLGLATSGALLGLPALGFALGALIGNATRKAEQAAMVSVVRTPGAPTIGATGSIMGAFAGLSDTTYSSGFHMDLKKGLQPGGVFSTAATSTGPVPHILDPREAARVERLAREQASSGLQADTAEQAVQRSIAGITGDTSGMDTAARKKIDDDLAETIRRAAGNQTIIANAQREAAAKRIEIEMQATNAFISAKQKEEQAVDRDSQFKLRAIDVQERANTALTDVQLSSVRRQIQIDEQRGAPMSRILSLYQQEAQLIQQKATAEQIAASRSIPILQEELRANQTFVDALRQRRDSLNADPATGLQGAANKAEALKLDQQITEESGHQLEITEKLNAAQNAGLKIQDQVAADMARIEAERRHLNPTFGEAMQDKVGQSQYGANREYADMAIDGIHNIGHALSDMLNKGKLDWISLGNVAHDVLTRIENKMLDQSIDRGLSAVFGKTQQGGTSGGGLGTLHSLLGMGSGKSGSIPGLSLSPSTGSFDASAVNWGAAGSAAESGGSLFQGITSGLGSAWSFLQSFFMHSGGILGISRRHAGLAPDESLNILQAGEMVLSRGETSTLFSGGAAKVPGGYRPSARIFMTDMGHATSRSSGGMGGGDGTHVHNWHISTPDPHSFGYARSEIQRQGAAAMSRASHRMN